MCSPDPGSLSIPVELKTGHRNREQRVFVPTRSGTEEVG